MYNSYIVFIWNLVISLLSCDKTSRINEPGADFSVILWKFNQLLCIS
jgi:hypothetical protein